MLGTFALCWLPFLGSSADALAVLRDRASDAPRLLPDGQTGNALLGSIALGAVVFLAMSASGVASPL